MRNGVKKIAGITIEVCRLNSRSGHAMRGRNDTGAKFESMEIDR